MRLLTLARDLTRRKARERDSLFVAEGTRSVEELLESSLEIIGMLASVQLREDERGRAVLERAERRGVEISQVSTSEFASAAGTESPQGVLMIGRIPVRTLDASASRPELRLLVLDSIQDPGNLGTIIRTAHALGVDTTVALPGTVDIWNAKVVRSAMGALFAHNALKLNWEEAAAFLDSQAVPLWASDPTGEPVDRLGSPPPRLAIALGNEGAGLSAVVRRRADRTIAIPMAEQMESLNVAVAAGIVLFALRGEARIFSQPDWSSQTRS
ncbi:MAG: TrmH family RNA methyltransferase [Gemmatimonadota bacterium]